MTWQLIGNIKGKDAIGRDGADGLGLTNALIDQQGHLIVTLSNGSAKDVGAVVGKDGQRGLDGKNADPAELHKQIALAVATIPIPKDGRDGVDGLGFDDMDLSFDPMTGWMLTLIRGEHRKSFELPIPFDAGVWESGRRYPKGAGVTVKGSYWLALEPTTARPGDAAAPSRAWRLAVKAGKDGTPGKDGRNGNDA